MKRKTYIIYNIKYYSLHAVTPAIGLTYHEVYHNYEKWEGTIRITQIPQSHILPETAGTKIHASHTGICANGI